jgi:hypothetical protein
MLTRPAGRCRGGGYLTGEFNARAITYDSSWTPEQLTAAMRPYGIFLKGAPSAADPT